MKFEIDFKSASSSRLRDKVTDSAEYFPCLKPAHKSYTGTEKKSVHANSAVSFGEFCFGVVMECDYPYDEKEQAEKKGSVRVSKKIFFNNKGVL